MTNRPLDDVLTDLRATIDQDVAAGYLAADDIVSRAVDYLSDELAAEVLQPHAARLTQAALLAHAKTQTSWPPLTDCDRLDAAFEELGRAGILARQNYSCCGNCGAAEIWAELEEAHERDPAVRGYTFFHQQDTERAVEGDGVYLNYGSIEDSEEAIIRIADEVIQVLRQHGLTVEWPRTTSKRIQISLTWQRRRPLG